MSFQEKLDTLTFKNNSLVCIGLDSDFEKIPPIVKMQANPQLVFNKALIDATHDLVCAYKLNSAFYESKGDSGILQLKLTCEYLRTTYPEIPIILDAKRGDIDNTNEEYVKFAYDYLDVDAITLNPYLGKQALEPFLKMANKGNIILCRTSNPGAGEFQDEQISGIPLYKIIAQKVTGDWNLLHNCLLVVGATQPQELAEIRKIAGDMTFLVPGVGTQGGDIGLVVRAGINSHNAGMIINASRSVIFASSETNYDKQARIETQKLRDRINMYRPQPQQQLDPTSAFLKDVKKQLIG